ncbi:MAG: rhomboid family intramembrane serine protease [Myxococcota bacterium]
MPTRTATPEKTRSDLVDGLKLLAGLVLLLWIVEIVDTVALGGMLQTNGIQPRSVDGLDGVLWAPFLHDDFAHLGANTGPFLILGGLVLLRGLRAFVLASLVIIAVAGLGTWAMAREATHIGASGVIFGYLGFLLAAGWYERSLGAVLVAAGVGFLYGGLLWGVLPNQPGISWEGHLFGLIGGVVAARTLTARRKTA